MTSYWPGGNELNRSHSALARAGCLCHICCFIQERDGGVWDGSAAGVLNNSLDIAAELREAHCRSEEKDANSCSRSEVQKCIVAP